MTVSASHCGSWCPSPVRLKLALGALAAAALVSVTVPAHALPITYTFKDIINTADPTFNQELGINSAGTIAGYFGGGAAGHPNKGYTTVPPYTSFTNENFPGSVQTQVTGINNVGTTVGFWSDTNLGGGDNNFGFVAQGGTFTNVNNPATGSGPAVNQLLGVNDGKIAVGFYVDAAGATHGYTYNIAANSFSGNIDDPNGCRRHDRGGDQQFWKDRWVLYRFDGRRARLHRCRRHVHDDRSDRVDVDDAARPQR